MTVIVCAGNSSVSTEPGADLELYHWVGAKRAAKIWGVILSVAVFGVRFFAYMAKKYMDKRTTFFSP